MDTFFNVACVVDNHELYCGPYFSLQEANQMIGFLNEYLACRFPDQIGQKYYAILSEVTINDDELEHIQIIGEARGTVGVY